MIVLGTVRFLVPELLLDLRTDQQKTFCFKARAKVTPTQKRTRTNANEAPPLQVCFDRSAAASKSHYFSTDAPDRLWWTRGGVYQTPKANHTAKLVHGTSFK